MPAPDLHRLLLAPLHGTGIAYMVTGSVASIAYGEPRLTNDVDVVLDLEAGASKRLASAFPETEYYVPPLEVIEEELARPMFGHFNIVHLDTALRADIYIAGTDPLHAWAFERRVTESMGGGDVWFAPIEYVIVRKLEYFESSGADRHLSDIAGMLRVSGAHIGEPALHELLERRGLLSLYQRARDR